jgi:hypothetical protein
MKAVDDLNATEPALTTPKHYTMNSRTDVDYLLKIAPTATPGIEGKRALNYKPYTVPKVPHHSNPKPRRDKTTVDTISRLRTIILKATARNQSTERFASQVGKMHGASFYLEATDGLRALFLPADGLKRESASFNLTEGGMPGCTDILLTNPDMFCAVERALTCCDERSHRVDLHILCGGLILKSEIPYTCEFDEAVQGMSDEFHIEYPKLTEIFAESLAIVLSINGKFLREALGSWPLRMFYSKDGNRVVFAPLDNSFRYVIALQR